MMKSFIILNILVFVYVGGKEMFPAQPRLSYLYLSKGQSSPRPPNWGEAGECCRRKVVGGITYRLVERLPIAFTYPYYCSTNCVYMTEGSDVKFCFKPGGLESECFDDGGTWPSGSYPPMTGGPPGSNMTEGPMTGGPTGGPTGSATGSPGGGKCGSVCLLSVSSTIMIIPYCDCLIRTRNLH